MAWASRAMALAVACLGLVAAPPSPAAAKGRPSCDAQRGVTIQANTDLRLYRRAGGSEGFRYETRVCMYATRHDRSLGADGRGARYLDTIYAINGKFAIKQAIELPRPNALSAGYTGSNEWFWDGRRERVRNTPGAPTTGERFSQVVLSPTGVIARLGHPSGLGLVPGTETGALAPRTDSVIEVFDPSIRAPSEGSWVTIASGPAGSLSDLVATPTRIVWWADGQVSSAPFGVPTG
jgi:hypothetical protein